MHVHDGEVGIDLCEDVADLRLEAAHVSVDPYLRAVDEVRPLFVFLERFIGVVNALRECAKDHGAGWQSGVSVFGIAGYAYDLEAVSIGGKVEAEVAAYGISTGEELAHEGLIDDGYVLRVFLIGEADLAAFHERLADGGEVIGADAIVFDFVSLVIGRRAFTGLDDVVEPVIAHGTAESHAGAANAGESFKADLQLAIDSVEIGYGVFCERRLYGDDEAIFRVKAEVLIAQVVDAVREHARDGDESE